MNVTVSLPDELCQEARHRAVNERTSLSKWVAGLVRRELDSEPAAEKEEPLSLAEAMRVPGMPESFYEKEFPLEDRRTWAAREFTFEPDED